MGAWGLWRVMISVLMPPWGTQKSVWFSQAGTKLLFFFSFSRISIPVLHVHTPMVVYSS